MSGDVAEHYRAFFVDELRLLSGLTRSEASERVLSAFGCISREKFAGPGPWTVRSALYGLATTRTPDDDPRHLYHCVLIALDEARGINIGEPSLWARLLSRTDIDPGSRILQVGTGSGYYTAILKDIAKQGTVLAFETDQHLADIASRNLSTTKGVDIRLGSAVTDLRDGDGPFDLIIAFAGVTHPVHSWINALKPDGRMLLPVTGTRGQGAMMLASRSTNGFDVTTLGACGFYHCDGARDDDMAKRIDAMWRDRTRMDGWRMAINISGGRIRYEVDGQSF